MSVRDISDHLQRRNGESLARWREKWFLQGGTLFHARPLQDLRNEDQLRRWRTIEWQVRQTGKSLKTRTVVNLAVWRMSRARKRKQA